MTSLPQRYYFTYDAYKRIASPVQASYDRPPDKELLVAFRASDFEKIVLKRFRELNHDL